MTLYLVTSLVFENELPWGLDSQSPWKFSSLLVAVAPGCCRQGEVGISSSSVLLQGALDDTVG